MSKCIFMIMMNVDMVAIVTFDWNICRQRLADGCQGCERTSCDLHGDVMGYTMTGFERRFVSVSTGGWSIADRLLIDPLLFL
jgi:hypothetical protein